MTCCARGCFVFAFAFLNAADADADALLIAAAAAVAFDFGFVRFVACSPGWRVLRHFLRALVFYNV